MGENPIRCAFDGGELGFDRQGNLMEIVKITANDNFAHGDMAQAA